eukprot:gnl/Chilomastix_cuspidata/2235.p3 GENE.gnl/Chilomastix_cuspidata/2235~~gnl/Chilomastix_cuspidata/2235.p3  ORF type:complete len:132 (+),score=55.28 gnl/Chilomastix_cuspidata/2235:973-1368(+)
MQRTYLDHSVNYPERFGRDLSALKIFPITSDSVDEKKSLHLQIEDEDYTIVNIIRHALLENPDVLFAGAKKPHPLYEVMEVRFSLADTSREGDVADPKSVIISSCEAARAHVRYMAASFDRALAEFDGEGA